MMTSPQPQLRTVVLLLILACIGVILVACNAKTSPAATPVSTAVSTEASLPLPSATPIPTTTSQIVAGGTATRNPTAVFEEFKGGYPPGALLTPRNAAAATQAVEQYNRLLTATALTPSTTPYPTETDVPTATPGVGPIADTGCVPSITSGAPRFPSCWEARVNNQWVLVGGGQVRDDETYRWHSFILVCPGPCWNPIKGTMYATPRDVVEARIANVTGTLVTVVPRDPTIADSFVFDLATGRWVAPPGASPYPVIATPPYHSPTPVPPP